MSSKFWLPTHRPPANGVAPRTVPGQMAPERCVTRTPYLGQHVQLIARDLTGAVRMIVVVHEEDVSSWLLKVIRHWLAWSYGASEIKIVS